jgi:hypothetical protein
MENVFNRQEWVERALKILCTLPLICSLIGGARKARQNKLM